MLEIKHEHHDLHNRPCKHKSLEWSLADFEVQDVAPQGMTYCYASPEQTRSVATPSSQKTPQPCKISGAAADMWSAGVVLFEMLTGELPFNPYQPPDTVTVAKGKEICHSTFLKIFSAWVSMLMQNCLHILVMRIENLTCLNCKYAAFHAHDCFFMHITACVDLLAVKHLQALVEQLCHDVNTQQGTVSSSLTCESLYCRCQIWPLQMLYTACRESGLTYGVLQYLCVSYSQASVQSVFYFAYCRQRVVMHCQSNPCHLSWQENESGQMDEYDLQGPATHPLLKKVRASSAAPDHAADFFIHQLHPDPCQRMTASSALRHPYLHDCFKEMLRSKIGMPWCHYHDPAGSMMSSEAATAQGALPARLAKQSAGLVKGMVTGAWHHAVRFATPPQHRQQAQLKPPSRIESFFPPYVMPEVMPQLSSAAQHIPAVADSGCSTTWE